MSSTQIYKVKHTFLNLRNMTNPPPILLIHVSEVGLEGEGGKVGGLIRLVPPVSHTQEPYLGHMNKRPVHWTCSIVKIPQAARDKNNDGVEVGMRVTARNFQSLIHSILYIACKLTKLERLST